MLRGFETTSWSVVLNARDEDSQGPREALNHLCKTYWPPVYSFFRSKNCSKEDAEDLTQEFFCRIMKRQFLPAVSRGRGKFRTYLLAAAENLLKDEHRKSHALKRGGGEVPFPLDITRAETLYAYDCHQGLDSRAFFDRHWAQAILDAVLERLEDEFSAAGRSQVFEVLKGSLAAPKGDASYRELGDKLGMPEGAVKVTVHRMRRRYGALLREEVGRTVEYPEQVEEELQYLFAAVSGQT